MYAYVINLARSSDRRTHIASELSKVGMDYEFIDGVDGRSLDIHDPKIIDPEVLGTTWFTPGVAGCALGHLRAHKKILEDGMAHALVLEDDVKLPVDLVAMADDMARYLDGAEVALLNFDSSQTIRMNREFSVKLLSGNELLLPNDITQVCSGAAYLVTREACERMIDYVVPFKAKADDWDYFYSRGALDRVRCVVQMPIAKDPEFGSTMDYNSQRSLKARTLGLVRRHDIKIAQRVIAYRRERILRTQIKVEIVDLPFVNKPSRLDA